MRFRLIFALSGRLVLIYCIAPLLFCLFSIGFGYWQEMAAFGWTIVLGGIPAYVASKWFREPAVIHRAEAMCVVALTWLSAAVISGIPYFVAGRLSPIDALFESMSGLTTTGATILTDFTRFSKMLFFWRATTQWFGGLGVISLFVIIMPRFGIAGRQILFTESSSAAGEALDVDVREHASKLILLYIGLTMICAFGLYATQMSIFDSAAHALTTLSAGGFSPNGASISGYANPSAEWVLIVFMILAGASFPLQYKVMTGFRNGAWRELFSDPEWLVYLGVAIFGGLSVGILYNNVLTEESFRTGLFQSASLISSTGFASLDYNEWSDSAKAVLVLIMLVGGCAGSAAGGPKVIRHILAAKHMARELKQSLMPNARFNITLNGKVVTISQVRAIFLVIMLYGIGFVLVGCLLALTGQELVTAFSAALACLGNVGPGFNSIGPMGSFGGLPPIAKIILIGAMWVGRLEIVTLMALLHPLAWRSARWSDPEVVRRRLPKVRQRRERLRTGAILNDEQSNLHDSNRNE